MIMMHKVEALYHCLDEHKVDGYIVSSGSTLLSPDAKRLQRLVGFSGSNGTLVVMRGVFVFYTDSRYLLQAERELDYLSRMGRLEIFDMYGKKGVSEVDTSSLFMGKVLGYDPYVYSMDDIDRVQTYLNRYNDNAEVRFLSIREGVVSDDCAESGVADVYSIEENAGQGHLSKIEDVVNLYKGYGGVHVDYVLITSSDSISWLLNVRCSDMDRTVYNPALPSYALLDLSTGKVSLFVDKNTLHKVKEVLQHDVYLVGHLSDHLFGLLRGGSRVAFDRASMPIIFMQQAVFSGVNANLVSIRNLIGDLQSIKNSVEINNIIQAHHCDALSWVRFLIWMENLPAGYRFSESEGAKMLLSLQKSHHSFISQSFPTISALNANGALVHYGGGGDGGDDDGSVVEVGCDSPGMYLCDAGCQYRYGTTDITRTVAVGVVSERQKKHFTLVLQGHIDLAMMVFPKGVSGCHLDAIARRYLWMHGADYGHSTGHGVGYCLSVHEGPQSISMRNSVEIKAGMVMSIEPGIYIDNEYGVRIENLYYVKKHDKYEGMLCFEPLTLIPIDYSLVEDDLLTQAQREWMCSYHRKIIEMLEGCGADDLVRELLSVAKYQKWMML